MKDITINPNMNLGIESPFETQCELCENETNERAKSKSQQRFFGMVDAYKKGEISDKEVSKSVKDAANGMSMKQVKDFAKTKHKGLPNHVDESNNKGEIRIKESQLRDMIKECIQQHLVDVLGKYTQGKATPKQANKAIMDFADSSNTGKTRVNEDAWMPDSAAPWNEPEDNSETLSYEFETIPFIFACMQDNNEMEEIEVMKQHMDELSMLPKQIGYWAEYDYYNNEIVNENFYFNVGTTEVSVSKWLQQNQSQFSLEVLQEIEYIAQSVLQFSESNGIEEFMSGVKRIINQQSLNESYADELHYTHFAVNKQTNKIVNGWDYSGKDNQELKQFKEDYFMKDLQDNGLNPKNYRILTVSGCRRRGIDPFDDSNWTNDDYFNAYTQPLY